MPDTDFGGAPAFPSTIWPLIDSLREKRAPDPQQALGEIITRYWRPVYAFIRMARGPSHEDAKDLTQEFFAFLLDGDILTRADRARGSFRTYLKTILRNFLTSQHRRNTSLKRGGETRIHSIELPDETIELPDEGADPERTFDGEWARGLMGTALADVAASLKRGGQAVQWEIFRARDLAEQEPRPSYEELARAHGLTHAQVNNYLQDVRGLLRETVVQKVREYASDEDQVWEELNYLMGLWYAQR